MGLKILLLFEKEKTACFSGHRIIKKEHENKLISDLIDQINSKIIDGYNCFICGGAVGFDTIAALCVLKTKITNPHIRLALALPYKNQHSKWPQADKTKYEYILENADEIIYVSDEYNSGCMLKRNRFMVDNSSLLIAYLSGIKGGTVYTYNYAIKSGIERVNLWK